MKFDHTAETEATRAADTEAKRSLQTAAVRNGSAVLIVVIVLVASLLVSRRLLGHKPEPFEALMSDTIEAVSTPTEPVTLQFPQQQVRAAPGARNSVTRAERVRLLAAERPDEVARQLQTWMSE